MTTSATIQPKTALRIENDLWWESATDEQKQVHRENLTKIKQWFKDATKSARYRRALLLRLRKDGYESLSDGERLSLREYSYNAPWEYRHRHIAYSLYRGRTYEQIENPSENNLPNQRLIQEHLDEYKKALRPDPA